MIIRPQSAADISSLIPILAKNNTPFAVRSGGHDMFNRSQVRDGVTIDMRDIAYVHIADDKASARVGGGIMSRYLEEQLEALGLTTPCPLHGAVGYVGWATHGGYGPLSTMYGLGVDQIIGAKVIIASGDVIDADKELLVGIRGGGGIVGVIAELVIRVYPVYENLGGVIQFPSSPIPETINNFWSKYSKLMDETPPPPNLTIYHAMINSDPPTLTMFFCWTSPSAQDVDGAGSWLQKILALAPNPTHTVGKTQISAFIQILEIMLPATVYGTIYTLNLRSVTPTAAEVMARGFESIPYGTPSNIAYHQLRGAFTTPSSASVFTARYPHYVVEIISLTQEESQEQDVIRWGKAVQDDFRQDKTGNVLPGSYINLTPAGDVDLDGTYGEEGLAVLRRLKAQYDPENVFRNALVRL
ncbi:hypothetical protein FE257_009662 [Aspergillus nanangensis]|uniref:FAD-binding PCMH-type domain-containing protein n=1 Tax=Aspergillus nanangensis TaxID=2582783 RepID=A0AAD4CJI2_ASPNN|nr:hypothetical protein FE257_009662 [Aspergillus nanangensis]